MSKTIYKPKTIKVGFQERQGTFTGRLAYITYIDGKGVLRKEKSWEGWRAKNIEPEEFENEPTEGFVINKKVGDYRGSWFDSRGAWIRVYDPRGFEFEITVNNLLWILENTTSIKGKGLEGKFVYAWDGKDLLLVPEDTPDFKDIMAFSNMNDKPERILGKDLIEGATYRTNQNTDLIYLGKFRRYETNKKFLHDGERFTTGYTRRVTYVNPRHEWTTEDKGNHYYFIQETKGKHLIHIIKSLTKRIVKTIDTNPHPQYAEFMEVLESNSEYSPYDPSADKFELVTAEDIAAKANFKKWSYSRFDGYVNVGTEFKPIRIGYNSGGGWQEVKPHYYVDSRNDTNIPTETYTTLEELVRMRPVYKRTKYLQNGKEMK